MRLALAGLMIVGLGIGLAEWARRNPATASEAAADAGSVSEGPSAEAVSTLTTPMPALPPGPEVASFEALVQPAEVAKGVTTQKLAMGVKVRELRGAGERVAFIAEKEKTHLVMVASKGSLQAWAARTEPIATLTLNDERVVWAEGGRIVSAQAPGLAETVAFFAQGQVMSLALDGRAVVAALVPAGADPFGTDPTGTVVRVEGTTVTVLAKGLVRPRDVIVYGKDAFFVAGYPAGLTRAALDGAFTSRIAERADGPLAFDGTGIVHRFPDAQAPEVRRVPRAGGSAITLSRADADWVAAGDGRIAYTTAGLSPRTFTLKLGEAPVELLAFDGATRGLAMQSERIWVLATDAEGRASVVSK
jgi:hypothetical protein